jgi:hypothetical protein
MSHSQSAGKSRMERGSKKYLAGALPEVLFAVLPLLVVALVLVLAKGDPRRVFSSPEWSFGSAVLFGQGIVKIVRSTLGARGSNPRMTAVVIAVILVVGLVPSLVILALMVYLEQNAPVAIMVWQMVWFFLAGSCSLLIGGVTEAIEEG